MVPREVTTHQINDFLPNLYFTHYQSICKLLDPEERLRPSKQIQCIPPSHTTMRATLDTGAFNNKSSTLEKGIEEGSELVVDLEFTLELGLVKVVEENERNWKRSADPYLVKAFAQFCLRSNTLSEQQQQTPKSCKRRS